jgi:hypothetical protein
MAWGTLISPSAWGWSAGSAAVAAAAQSLGRPSKGSADALCGVVALVGGVGGVLLGGLGSGQGGLAECAASLDVLLRGWIVVLAVGVGRVDEGEGRCPNHTRRTGRMRRGAAEE